MTKKQARVVQQRKVKDKWKAKTWFTVRAPKMFNEVVLAETPADEALKLMGRVTEVTLQDINGDFSKMHIKCYFRVTAVNGSDAKTAFAGHELTSDYIRRLTRRKHSKLDLVVDVKTKDGFTLRVKPMAVTERRAQATQVAEMRRRATAAIQARGAGQTYADLLKDLLTGEMARLVHAECRKIYPLKRVEIRKSEVLREPGGEIEFTPIFAPREEPAPPQAGPAPEAPAAEPAPDGGAAPTAAPAPEAPAEKTPTEEEDTGER